MLSNYQERLTRIGQRQEERIGSYIDRIQYPLSRDVRREQRRMAKEIKRDQKRIAKEAKRDRKRIVRDLKRGRASIMTPAINPPLPRAVNLGELKVSKQRSDSFPAMHFDELDKLESDRRPRTVDTYRSPSAPPPPRCCPTLLLAREFILSLNWPPVIFNSDFDRCYCPSCYKFNWKDVSEAGGAPYVIPRGWVRLGVLVDPVVEQIHDIWDCWQVTYHGTSIEAALSILKHRQFSIPGDQLLTGNFLSIRPGHIPEKYHIYTSPTIAYSSLPVYCPSYEFISYQNKQYLVKIVLECRQNPELMHIQGETVGKGRERICPFIPNSKIEYLTEVRASLIAYGLLLNFEEIY